MQSLRSLALCFALTACSDGGDLSSATETQGIEALTQRAIAAYDRQMNATCTCLVAEGMYESQEACLMLLGSGSTWADCGSQFLEEHDSSETREQMDCFVARSEKQASCVADAACKSQAVAQCAEVPAACAESQPGIVLELLQRCPDLGLLSRLHGQ